MDPAAPRELKDGEAPASALPETARRLLSPSPRLGVPVPAYGGRSLPNVMSSLLRALGQEARPGELPPLSAEIDPFAGRRSEGPVILVVVDGLGWPALKRAGAGTAGPRVARWAADSVPITTVFPSGTTVALASLSTASAPSQHGVVGHRAYLPRFGSVVELLRMSPLGVAQENALAGPDGKVEGVLGRPTVFHGGLRAVSVSRDRFEGSGFTRMIYDGARYVPYATFSDLAHELRRTLLEARGPELLLVYWDELDAALHLRGPSEELTGFEVDRLGSLFSWVARGLPARTAATPVWVTADHGLVPADAAAQLDVDRDGEALSLLARPPAGDRRATFFQARRGAVDPLRRLLQTRMEGRGTVLEVAAAIDAGLFGPPPFHPELVERVGELLVLADPPGGVGYRLPGHAPPRRVLRGAHGGLDAEELLVPFLARPLAEFASSA